MMRRVDKLDTILDLLGDLVVLGELRNKNEIYMLLKQRRSTPRGLRRVRRGSQWLHRQEHQFLQVSGPHLRPLFLLRLPHVNRPRSMNSSMSAVWSEFGGSYDTTPSLLPFDLGDIKHFPCHGKGKGMGRIRNKSEQCKRT